jgi:hypothetical protein
MFAIVDVKTGVVVAGGSVDEPAMTLIEVEAWFNDQAFVSKLAADGTRMRDVSPSTMTAAQRDVVLRMRALPVKERLELARYFSISHLREKLT